MFPDDAPFTLALREKDKSPRSRPRTTPCNRTKLAVRSPRIFLGLVLFMILLVVINSACASEPAEEEEMSLSQALAIEPVDRRPNILEQMGAPDAFTLVFGVLEAESVRSEQWSYFDFQARFDFIDGELLWTVELEPVPDGSVFAHFYDPGDFQAFMSMSAVRQLLADQELEAIDLEEEDIPGGLILVGDQIILGFDQDQLVYVETFILSPEEAS